MAVANLKNIFRGGGSSVVLKAGQSYAAPYGIGYVQTASIDVSSSTDIINLSGRWALTFAQLTCTNAGAGTMTASLVVDGVAVLASASVGTAGNITIFGLQLFAGVSDVFTPANPIIICNSSIRLTIQRSTTDAVSCRYTALAIE